MATFTDLVNDIKADLTLNGSDYDASIVRKGQNALRRLRGRRYWFLRVYDTSLTTTADSETVNVTTTFDDFSVIESLDLIANGQRMTDKNGFDRLSFDELRAQYWNESTIPTGTPEAWAISNGTIYLSHKSSSAYTLPITYYKQDASLPGAGGTTVWGDDGYEVLRAMTMNIFKRDTEGYNVAESDREILREELQAIGETHINKTSGEY